MDMNRILSELNQLSLEEMAPVITLVANKSYEWRLAHNGYVPFSVFEDLLGPVTVSVQIVHEVRNASGLVSGYALRLRESNEAGDVYKGLYHSTCTSFRWTDSIESALARNNRESVGDNHPSRVEYLGITYHHEVSRRNMDLTFMHRRVISSSLEQVRWVLSGGGSFSHLRATFPPGF
jgi:hypothetical protein